MAIRGFVSIFLVSYLFFFSRSLCSVSAQKVSLALYYETLCPGCASFIVYSLSKIFENGLIDIVDLKLIPYGNAGVGPNGTITCQHGPYECLLNTVDACVLHTWPDLNTHFPLIYCIEGLVLEGQYKQWKSCFEKTGLGIKPVADCYNGGLGTKLELQYAAETKALQPPHQYVPWVVVDGQPLYTDDENFITYICKAYKGTVLPKACVEAPLQIMQQRKEKQNHQACFVDESSTSTSSAKTPNRRWLHPLSWRHQRMVTSE